MMKDRLDQADNDAKTTVEKYMKLLEAKNVSNTGCKRNRNNIIIKFALIYQVLINVHYFKF